MAQLVERLTCKHEDLSSVSHTHEKAGYCGMSLDGAETGRSWGLLASQRMLFGELLAHGRSFLRHKNVVW